MNSSFKPSDVKAYLDRFIVGQEEAKKAVSNVLYNSQLRLRAKEHFGYHQLDKLVILLAGETGTGKTYMITKAAEFNNSVVKIVDSTSLMKTGYSGEGSLNASTVAKEYITACYDKAKEKYEETSDLFQELVDFYINTGFVVFDEFDKISDMGNGSDAFGYAIQDNLLKFIEGGLKVTVHDKKYDTLEIPCVLLGAFSALYDKKKEVKTTIGFSKYEEKEVVAKLTKTELGEAGFKKELLARIGTLVELNPLTDTEFRDILLNVQQCAFNQYRSMFNLHGVNVTLSEKTIESAIKSSRDEKIGARGLKGFFISRMSDIIYDLPDIEDADVEIDIEDDKLKLVRKIL